jgi:hypothetical protein
LFSTVREEATGLINGMSLLFGLADVGVECVVPLTDGTREVHVRNASEVAAGCQSFGCSLFR